MAGHCKIMSSESALLQLPEDIFHDIIVNYVHTVRTHEASATRAVCSKIHIGILISIRMR